MARRITREEGIFVGGSAGLIATLAVRVAREVDDPDALVVCVLPDTGERYLSKVFNDEWMRENQMLDGERAVAVGELLRHKVGPAPALVGVQATTPVRQALSTMNVHNISQLPVLHDGDCIGSVSESTLMARVIADPALMDRPAETLMDAPFPVVDEHIDAHGLARLLTRENPAVLVRRGGALVGIVTRYDMVRFLTR